MSCYDLPPLRPEDGFYHVIYEHRYFALAANAWERIVDPRATGESKDGADGILPGIGVLLQDSLLLHVRNLADFYCIGKGSGTDVAMGQFWENWVSAADLDDCRHPISVHLGHITAWRDKTYRERHKKHCQGETRQRIDWNTRIPDLIESILGSLHGTTASANPWQQAFVELEAACLALYADPHYVWPPHLGERADVDTYLRSVGLPQLRSASQQKR